MTSRTHAGALCQQEHLTHRTLLEARRCDAETAEARALHLYLRIHRQSGEPTSRRLRRVIRAPRLLTLAVAIVRRLIRPDA